MEGWKLATSIRRGALAGVFSLAALLSSAAALQAGQYNINFDASGVNPADTYGAASGQIGTWNIISANGLTSGLLDISGAATTVSLGLTSDAFGGVGDPPDTGTDALRRGNFYSYGHVWDVTLSNLDDGAYDLYYYAPKNTSVPTKSFTANGVSAPNIAGNAAGTLVQGQDWQMIVVSVSGGALHLTSEDTAGFGGLAGLQLVAVGSSSAAPEPSTMMLLGALLIPVAVRRFIPRRREK